MYRPLADSTALRETNLYRTYIRAHINAVRRPCCSRERVRDWTQGIRFTSQSSSRNHRGNLPAQSRVRVRVRATRMHTLAHHPPQRLSVICRHEIVSTRKTLRPCELSSRATKRFGTSRILRLFFIFPLVLSVPSPLPPIFLYFTSNVIILSLTVDPSLSLILSTAAYRISFFFLLFSFLFSLSPRSLVRVL